MESVKMETRNDWTTFALVPSLCTVSVQTDSSPSHPSRPPPPPLSATISSLSCGDRPSVAELPPYTVPPVFPGGRTGWWMEESRPGEPPLHPLLLLQKSDSQRGKDPFVCHTKFLSSSVSLGISFTWDRTSVFNSVDFLHSLTCCRCAHHCLVYSNRSETLFLSGDCGYVCSTSMELCGYWSRPDTFSGTVGYNRFLNELWFVDWGTVALRTVKSWLKLKTENGGYQ